MSTRFRGWQDVDTHAHDVVRDKRIELNPGQAASLLQLTTRLKEHGAILADEVGMGKTRIAVALAHCVVQAGGRVAIVAPPGLDDQWRRELQRGGLPARPLLRSVYQYLQAWEHPHAPAPWFDEPVVLLSHYFARWRLGGASHAWRWALLPELIACWRKHETGAAPWGYKDHPLLTDPWVNHAAASIVERLAAPGHRAERAALRRLADIHDPWVHALAPDGYGNDTPLRQSLQRATGLGLGSVDLIIIDEAHKSRSDSSLLNQLLNDVLLAPGGSSRRLAMSATPVELDASQWTQTLQRIGLPDEDAKRIQKAIDGYVAAVANVRRFPFKEGMVEAFTTASQTYQTALAPYVLRRDKREDAAVQSFRQHAGGDISAYRRIEDIRVTLDTLPSEWKRAVCAAEALSLASRQREDAHAKRQRLTIGNGHGIAEMIDQAVDPAECAAAADAVEDDTSASPAHTKRIARTAWWTTALRNAVRPPRDAGGALYQHPAILAAAQAIEAICDQGEKVLVFARYRAPMDALAHLLNARRLLRALDAGLPWPQQRIHQDEWPAVQAVHATLHPDRPLDRTALDAQLAANYQQLENSRQRFRTALVATIGEGMRLLDAPLRRRFMPTFRAFQEAQHAQHVDTDGAAVSVLAAVARALADHLGEQLDAVPPEEVARAFIELVQAATNLDPGSDDEDERADKADDEGVGADTWSVTAQRVTEDYAHNRGGFARLMHGGTGAGTRRLLQLAFNREHAFPRVLIAQSMVGREGLNLHLACRTVVLLHSEWNPAVVEQQIGRVDRLGSLWERKLADAIRDNVAPDQLPRIEIRPVVFEGTYDETHWAVLTRRWDNLRAQLHGDILPPCAAGDEEGIALRRRIAEAAPQFSPSKAAR
ncbi:helicase-related protein [Stenotrophomonas maltophilia]|uniref:Type III restriction endonuclease subunit R n=2 Tax=Stenotrophomonas TaxID=40323 RepID=A0A4S2CZU8_STEMA|nr:helicase-related protein [Stenotrophomonas maltophilia]TGY34152.1 type III restriction endonuclease subunit R [Stenotrophomonas maltophilia]